MQIQYLESEIHKLIFETEKAELDNTQKTKSPNLSEVHIVKCSTY